MSPIKKIFSFLLCLALVCGLFPAAALAATPDPGFILSTDEGSNVYAAPGETITVYLSVSAGTDMSLSLIMDNVSFDQDFFEAPDKLQKIDSFEALDLRTDTAGTHFIKFSHVNRGALAYTAGAPMQLGSFELKVKANATGTGTVRNNNMALWNGSTQLQPSGQNLTVTITGSTAPDQVTLSFDTAGGNLITSQTVPAGTTFPSISPPSRDGYTFKDWSPALPSVVPDKDTVYTATWLKNVQVSFDANGGSGTQSSVGTIEGNYTLPNCRFDPPEGKEFDGWAMGSAGGTKYAAGDKAPINADTVFYALWKEADEGGGSGTGTGTGRPNSGHAIQITQPANGTVSVYPNRAVQGQVVTLTITAAAGYEPGQVTVTDANGNPITVTAKGDRQFSFVMPGTAVTINAEFQKVDGGETTAFIDVSQGTYYYDAVYWAVDKGVTNGKDAVNTFKPLDICTRSEAVTFLWRAAGCPEPAGTAAVFSDVSPDAFYYKAVLWAIEQGITKGIGANSFGPAITCDRGTIVTFLYRMVGTPAVSGEGFEDVPDGAYYEDATLWAVDNGVTNGTNAAGTLFSPLLGCDRSQIVTFLWRHFAE